MKKECIADNENELSNLLPKRIYSINTFFITLIEAWVALRKVWEPLVSSTAQFAHVRSIACRGRLRNLLADCINL